MGPGTILNGYKSLTIPNSPAFPIGVPFFDGEDMLTSISANAEWSHQGRKITRRQTVLLTCSIAVITAKSAVVRKQLWCCVGGEKAS